jgi:hypothetical protein
VRRGGRIGYVKKQEALESENQLEGGGAREALEEAVGGSVGGWCVAL